MRSINRLVFVLMVLMLARPSAFAADTMSVDLVDTPPLINEHVSFEAEIVDLVLNSSGEVVQVVGSACERCNKKRYLPSRGLRLVRDGADVLPEAIGGLSGSSATILINKATGMAEQVRFFAAKAGESHEN